MEVAEKNCCLRAGDDQNNEDEEQESIHIVDMRRPDRIENKEQLDEYASERQNSTHNDARNWLESFPCMIRFIYELSIDM